jgi:hypothetical protein
MERKVLLVFAFVIGVIVLFASIIKILFLKIDWDYNIKKVYFKDLKLSDLITGSLSSRIDVDLIIKNRSTFNINIRNFTLYLYYSNILIAKSNKSINLKSSKLVDSHITETMDIIVNEKSIEFSKDLLSKSDITVQYFATMNILGLPLNIKGDYPVSYE